MSDKFDNVLIHYGMKGMKWGVRKDRNSKKATRKTRKEIATRQARKDAYSRRRTLKQGDLDALVKRLEQEKKLKTLLNEDLNPGRTFVNNSMKTAGGKVLTAVATGVGVTLVATVLAQNWGSGAVGRAVSTLATNIPKIKK